MCGVISKRRCTLYYSTVIYSTSMYTQWPAEMIRQAGREVIVSLCSLAHKRDVGCYWPAAPQKPIIATQPRLLTLAFQPTFSNSRVRKTQLSSARHRDEVTAICSSTHPTAQLSASHHYPAHRPHDPSISLYNRPIQLDKLGHDDRPFQALRTDTRRFQCYKK
jgi:hypothetical protein